MQAEKHSNYNGMLASGTNNLNPVTKIGFPRVAHLRSGVQFDCKAF